MFALHDVTLQYKEPHRLRLTAVSPKDGNETLLFEEDQRRFMVGEGRTVSHQDLSGSPARRSFLFEFCGVLTSEMFDTIRARFVKQETMDGVPTLVYDLTYWGQDDGPYHRIWIDPARRLILKQERFDADSKLKSIFLYKQPSEIVPGLWLPGTTVIQDSHGKTVATIKVSKGRANQGIP